MSNIHILKFGGTSLQNLHFIKQAAGIVRERAQSTRTVVVVSAIGGVTDRLLDLVNYYESLNGEAEVQIKELQNQHLQILDQIESTEEEKENLDELFLELANTYSDNKQRSENQAAWRDRVLSVGERASARIFTSALRAEQLTANTVDAHHYVRTDKRFGEASIQPETTRALLAEKLRNLESIPVITGFIGSTHEQEITTLGRSGSDYTAGLVADALGAKQLEIWTDVNGVLTADPKLVPDARNIPSLSFDDISELSAHGAKVIHPKTIQPVKESDITVYVKNSLQPSDPGTRIHKDHNSNGEFRSVTVTGPLVSVLVLGVHAKSLFHQLDTLLEEKSTYMAYGYSHDNIFEQGQLTLPESAYQEIQKELEKWASNKGIQLDIRKNLSIVHVFTNSLTQSDKPVAQILDLLLQKNLRPLHIQRQNGKRRLSLLFQHDDVKQAAQTINRYLISQPDTVDIFVAGVGAVGGTLLNNLQDFHSDKVRFRVIGLCNSRKTIFRDEINKEVSWTKSLESGAHTHWPDIISKLTEEQQNPVIFVDATGSEVVARSYSELLKSGIHIVTPSKIANTLDQEYYDSIRNIASQSGAAFRYETTVGAGLPIISTLKNLIESGEAVIELSGVLSGTMNYLFTELEKGIPFSRAVLEAREKGYAEPDPRDDLSGEDVARKFLTLARETGLSIERDALEVESLIPDSLREVDLETFTIRLNEYDSEWEAKTKQVTKQGQVLRYTGKLKGNKIQIGIEQIPKNSPLGQLQGTDNLLLLRSRSYDPNPLIIQGPGAGREVTANGVLTDILKIARTLI